MSKPEDPAPSGPVRTILIAHSDTRFCELLQLTLVNAGFDVCAATEGEEALSLFRRCSPDLVMLDLILAAREGREFCRLLRGGQHGRNVPLILLSDSPSAEASLQAMEVGAVECLTRPFSPPEILLRVKRVLDGQEESRALAQSNTELGAQLKRSHDALDEARRQLRDQRSGLQSLAEYHRRLDPRLDREGVERQFLLHLAGHFQPAGICLFERPGREAAWIVPSRWQGVSEDRVRGLRLPLSGEFLRILTSAGGPLRLPEFDQVPGTSWEAGILTAAGFTLVVPFLVQGELTGLVTLGDRAGAGRFDAPDLELLNLLVSSTARMVEEVDRLEGERTLTIRSVQILVDRIESLDPFRAGHSRRVARLVELIGRGLELPRREMDDLLVVAGLHDVGNTLSDPAIMAKKGPLDEEEWIEVRQHPSRGARLAAECGWPDGVQNAILHHHEFWSGGGYPSGLKRDAIPLPARIVAVADCFDAMTSARPYRGPLPEAEVRRYLQVESGNKYDPQVVDAFLARGNREEPLGRTGS